MCVVGSAAKFVSVMLRYERQVGFGRRQMIHMLIIVDMIITHSFNSDEALCNQVVNGNR